MVRLKTTDKAHKLSKNAKDSLMEKIINQIDEKQVNVTLLSGNTKLQNIKNNTTEFIRQ